MKFLIHFLIIYIITSSSLFSKDRVLKIAITKDFEPFSFYDKNNMPKGFFIDYWNLWAKKSKQKIEFVPMFWDETLKSIKDNKVDIHSGLFYSKDRSKYISYSKGFSLSKSYIYIHGKNKDRYKDIDDLKNKKVGVIAGSLFQNFLNKNYPKIKTKGYRNYDELAYAFDNFLIDAFLDDAVTVWYRFVDLLKTSKMRKLPSFEFENMYYSGVKKGDIKLEKIVFDGVSKITITEIIALEKKWIKNEKLHFNASKNISFSPKELEFIKRNPVIKFSEVNWKPLSIIEAGVFSGIFNDYINIIEVKTGLKFEYKKAETWLEAINLFREGKIDFLPVVGVKGKNELNPYTKLGSMSNEFFSFNYAIVTNKKGIFADDIKDLEDKTVALPLGYTSYNFIKANYPELNILETKNEVEALKKVSRGEAYAFVGHIAISIYNIKNYFQDLKIVGLTNNEFNHHFLISYEKLILRSIVNKVISHITYQEKRAIRDKWVDTRVETEVDLSFMYKIIALFVLISLVAFLLNINLKRIVRKKTYQMKQLLNSFDKSVIAAKVDFEGKTIYSTTAFCRKFGYKSEELLGKTHTMLRHPTLNDAAVLNSLLLSYKEGTNWQGEMCYLTKNKEEFWASIKRKPDYNDKGQHVAYLHIFYDITQHKKVKKLNFELNNLLSSYDENVIASKTDASGNIIYVSRAFCEISQYTKEELINKNHSILSYKNNTNEFYDELWGTIKLGEVWRGEIQEVKKDGSNYWLYSIITPEYTLNGDFLCYTAIFQDITSSKIISEANSHIEILNTEIEDTQREVVFRMGAIAEARSKETGAHVKRVAEYSYLLAKYYGLSNDEATTLKLASPMHDIGKVAIPDYILNKPGQYTYDEFEVMKRHCILGYEMLSTSSKPILKAASIVAYEHQEKYDGSGYPRGLKGDEIHIFGRITAVADVFDALGSDRCYKKAWKDERIFKLFIEEKGKHFEPKLIDIFFNNIDEFLKIRNRFKDDL